MARNPILQSRTKLSSTREWEAAARGVAWCYSRAPAARHAAVARACVWAAQHPRPARRGVAGDAGPLCHSGSQDSSAGHAHQGDCEHLTKDRRVCVAGSRDGDLDAVLLFGFIGVHGFRCEVTHTCCFTAQHCAAEHFTT